MALKSLNKLAFVKICSSNSPILESRKKIIAIALLTMCAVNEIFVKPFSLDELKNPFFYRSLKKMWSCYNINPDFNKRTTLYSKFLKESYPDSGFILNYADRRLLNFAGED